MKNVNVDNGFGKESPENSVVLRSAYNRHGCSSGIFTLTVATVTIICQAVHQRGTLNQPRCASIEATSSHVHSTSSTGLLVAHITPILTPYRLTPELYESLWDQKPIIQALVKHHFRLSNRDTTEAIPLEEMRQTI